MKNKSTLAFYTLLFSFCITLFSFNTVIAQENGIYEISGSDTQKNKNKSNNDRNEFYDLAFNLQPTHYIKNSGLNTIYDFGDPIKMTFEDTKSLDWLNNINSKKDSLELLIIYLNNLGELNNKLNIMGDKDFKKLKYVFIKCDFKCSENDIIKFIKADTKVRIFYTNEIGG
jgi:hypothetical protein